MSRFIRFDGGLINVDHIMTVDCHPGNEKMVFIRLVDGSDKIVSRSCVDAIAGHNEVVSIVPCTGIAAEVDTDDGVKQYPVRHLALMADGAIRPVDVSCNRIELFDKYSNFINLVATDGQPCPADYTHRRWLR